MALWGNKDTKSVTGTLSFTSGSTAVTGVSTLFTTELAAGQRIVATGGQYQIASIESATALTLAANATATSATETVTANEKPAYLDSTDSSSTFGVNVAEVTAGSDNVTSVAVANQGTRYLGTAPAVTFTGGGGSSAAATATISGGVVTAITVTNVGSAYTSVPTVAVAKPARIIPTSGITTGTDTIAYTAHGLNAGDVVKYFHGGGTAATGLADNTTYYVISSGLTANAFKVSATDGGTTVDITGTGNNAQYFELQTADQATAVAALGAGAGGTNITHPGWVLQTVGTGGRAGRVTFETLVAMKTISGDGADDLVLPDA